MPSNASAQLHAISAALKVAGEREIDLAMSRGLRAGAAPLIPAVRAAAVRELPKSGGLNEYIANQKINVSVRKSARAAGVRLTTQRPSTKQTDQGYARHPRFGHRDKGDWYVTKTRAGWWSDTLARESGAVTPALLKVMEEVAAKIRAV